jgi:hypothetical protein
MSFLVVEVLVLLRVPAAVVAVLVDIELGALR